MSTYDEAWVIAHCQRHGKPLPDGVQAPRTAAVVPEELYLLEPPSRTASAYPIIEIALRLLPEKNQGAHWAPKSRRVKKHREITYQYCTTWWTVIPPLPFTVTLTRLSPGTLDEDNLALACSPCRDGVADWLCGRYGKGQDRLDGLTWHYAQTHGEPGYYAVRIELEREEESK